MYIVFKTMRDVYCIEIVILQVKLFKHFFSSSLIVEEALKHSARIAPRAVRRATSCPRKPNQRTCAKSWAQFVVISRVASTESPGKRKLRVPWRWLSEVSSHAGCRFSFFIWQHPSYP